MNIILWIQIFCLRKVNKTERQIRMFLCLQLFDLLEKGVRKKKDRKNNAECWRLMDCALCWSRGEKISALTCIFVRPRSGRHRRGWNGSHTIATFLVSAWRALTATWAECKRDVHRYIFVCQPSSSGDGASAVVARATLSAISRPFLPSPHPHCSDYWLFAFSLSLLLFFTPRYLRLGKEKQQFDSWVSVSLLTLFFWRFQ